MSVALENHGGNSVDPSRVTPEVQNWLVKHHLSVGADSPFQRRARVLQGLWREDHGYPIGQSGGRPLGSRLASQGAKDQLWNYLTDGIRRVVRKELFDEGRDRGKVFGKPRIFDNMLSSQPLCFNLFGELSLDLDAATDVARILWPDRVDMIRSIKFEHSPGRGDANYLSNKSAFDVYLEHSTPTGGRGFIGIEVKYHENLRAAPARHKPRYDEVAAASGAFKPGRTEGMHKPPLQQLWLDHLLALSMLQGRDWDTGLFVLLHPTHNKVCSNAWRDYSARLRPESHAEARTIEELVGVISKVAPRPWVTEFEHRYLDFPRVHEFGL